MEMVKTKKSALLLMVLALTSSMALAACGSKDDEKETKTETTPAATTTDDTTKPDDKEAAPASDLKPYKLVMVYPGTAQPDEAKVEEEINKYLTEKINATIDLQPIDWTAWEDKVNLMIASRDPVDIFFTAQWTKYAVNVGKKAFLDLAPYLDKYGADIKAELDPAYLEGSKIDDYRLQ